MEAMKCRVVIMLTCFNRKEHTISCIRSLHEGNPNTEITFVVVDDNSTDGTEEALESMQEHIIMLHGDGSLFWNGGMHTALDYALKNITNADYYMLVNDDVAFLKGAIEALIVRQRLVTDSVVVGSTADINGKTSYGGKKKTSVYFAKFEMIEPSKEIVYCDTFNANCVLIPKKVFRKAGNVDAYYKHSMSDFDYGLKLKNMGVPIINAEGYIGVCNKNNVKGTWNDITLSRVERIRKKESPKGLPTKEWFYFVRKYYGILPALYHTATPYIKILFQMS